MSDPTAPDQWRLANRARATSNESALRDIAQFFLAPELIFREEFEFGRICAKFSLFSPDTGFVGRIIQVDEVLPTEVFKPNCYVAEIKDADDRTLLVVSRELSMKVRVKAYRPDGEEIGRLEQQGPGILGAQEIFITNGGLPIGVLRRTEAFSHDFHILDQNDNLVASVLDVWDGFARELFTNTETHVLVTPRPVSDPLRPLLLVCPLVVAFLKKQESD